MNEIPDFNTLAQALAATIATGTYKAAPIDALMVGADRSGRVTDGSVRVLLPNVAFEDLGEGWRVNETQWPIMLYTGSAGEVTPGDDLALQKSVLEALIEDPTCGGACAWTAPTLSQSLGAETYSGEAGAQMRLLRRELFITMTHSG